MGAAESTTSRVTVGWEEAERETPEGFEVLYPPPPLDADALRRLAQSATRLETEIAPFGALYFPRKNGHRVSVFFSV
jgi:hypothetical protein